MPCTPSREWQGKRKLVTDEGAVRLHHSKAGRDEVWQPTILNMHKHVLLKEVLGIFARSRSFTKLASDTNDILKKMATDAY